LNPKTIWTLGLIATMVLTIGLIGMTQVHAVKADKRYCYLNDQNIKCFDTKQSCNTDRIAQHEEDKVTKCRPY